jgi:hypothetical protein
VIARREFTMRVLAEKNSNMSSPSVL